MSRPRSRALGRLAALALVALVLPQTSCAALLGLLSGNIQRPQLSVKRVDIAGVSLAGIATRVVLDAKNPNPYAIDLGRFGYKLSIDGNRLLEGTAQQGFNLAPNASSEVVLPVEFRFTELGNALMALFTKKEVAYGMNLVLGFNSPVGVIDVPIDHAGVLPVPQLPDVSLDGASVGNLDFTGATLNVRIGLKNNNAFALPLGALNYKISVAGIEVGSGGQPAPELAANASAPISLPLRVNFLNTGNAVVQAVRGGTVPIKLEGGLDLPALGRALPFTREGSFSLR